MAKTAAACLAPRLSAALLASTALCAPVLLAAPAAAQSNAPALPQGGRFAAGQGTIGAPTANSLAVTQQSARGVIDWRSFNVGQGATVTFQNGSGATLNRVTGGDLTQILGTLRATGTLFVVNPQGVVVGQTGVVATGGSFVASTLGIANDAFMRGGTLLFRADGSGANSNAEVRNLGQIMAGAGDVVLIARSVTNAGTVQAPRGTAALAAGSEVLLREGPDGSRGMVRVRGASGDVTNSGLIEAAQAELRAAGGNVYALAGNNGGAVRATGTETREGRVWLSARADGANVAVEGAVSARNADGSGGQVSARAGGEAAVAPAGRLDASGTAGGQVRVRAERVRVEGQVSADGSQGAGGRVRVRAAQSAGVAGAVTARGAAAGGTVEADAGAAGRVEVTGSVDASSAAGTGGRAVLLGNEIALRGATVDASGAAGGGVVRVGGGREGGEGLREAATVTADAATTIRADAGSRGSGGDVVLWSTGRTEFQGLITARGGSLGGDGGEAEVSSRGVLTYDGTTNLLAPAGRTGTLLLDPYNIVISSGTQTTDASFVPGQNDSVINATTLSNALATASVTVSTGAANSPGGQAGNITVAAPISWSGNTLLTLTAANAIAINAPITVTGGGQVALNYNATTPNAAAALANLSFSATSTVGGTGALVFQPNAAQATQALTINGDSFTLLRSMADVANMSGTGRSALAAPLTAPATPYGDTPVSASRGANSFTGTFTGLGNTISGLTINATGNNNYGLFGTVGAGGTVRDVGLLGGSVTGGATAIVGPLVGTSSGTVALSFATGTATGGTNANVGGLVGYNKSGVVTSSYATGAASTQGIRVGGLVGWNTGSIAFSFATGVVTGGGGGTSVGGLVGENSGANFGTTLGTITSSYATGAVKGGDVSRVGGLAGTNLGAIASSFATGSVAGASAGGGIGGLVGVGTGIVGINPGTVANSFWDVGSSGQTTSAGGTGLTMRQMQGLDGAGTAQDPMAAGGLNTANAGAFARPTPGIYPYLERFFPNGVQVVSGTVYRDFGATPLTGTAGTVPVTVTNGTASLLPTTAGADGAFYAFGPAGTLPAGQGALAFTTANAGTGATNAARLLAPGAGLTAGADIWGPVTLLAGSTGAATLSASGINPGGVPAVPTGALVPAFVQGALPTFAATNAAGFTMDSAITAGTSFAVQTAAGAPLTVSAPVTVAGASLGLLSGGALSVNAPVQLRGGGSVALSYDASSPLNLSFSATSTVGGAGALSFRDASGAALAAAPTGANAQSLTVNGSAYTLLYSMADVAGMNGTGRAALAAPLDASAMTYSNAVVTASRGAAGFTGTFTGLGNAISDLTIASSAASPALGLFGVVGTTGTVRDIGIAGGSVSTGSASATLGPLAALNRGTVALSYATAGVTGGIVAYAGGLVGWGNGGSVTSSYATGAVSGSTNSYVGGLLGYLQSGSVRLSFATGSAAIGGTIGSVGGLVGQADPTTSITSSVATAAASGGLRAGGLAGFNGGTISSSFATGAVSGASSVGGLVGAGTGPVSNSFWDKEASGRSTSAGGTAVVGLTTRQLQGLDPMPGGASLLGALSTANSGAFAGGSGGLYPYLVRFFPNGVQAVTGTVYGDAGVTLAARASVGVAAGSASLLPATSGANGAYYAFGAAGTLPASTPFVAWTGTSSATLARTGASPAALTTGVNLWANSLRAPTASLTWSGAFGGGTPQAAALAATSVAAARTAINGAATARVDATGASFTLDTALTGSGALPSALTVTTGTGAGLTVGAAVAATGSISLLSGGDLTIASGGTVSGASPVLSTTGAFVNNRGGDALTAASGRWLVYSANPAGNTFGGLDSGNTAVWNTAAGGTVPATGNRYVFANQPMLTVTTTNLAKTEGDTASVANAYTVTGFHPGVAGAFLADTMATAVTGAPTVASAGAAAGATAAGSPYAITATLGTLASPAGYGFQFSNAGLLTVNAAGGGGLLPLTVTADSFTITYGQPLPTFTATTSVPNVALTGLTFAGSPALAAVNAGGYAINPSGATAQGYAITFVPGLLTINPAPLLIRANDASRAYGDANPTFTASFQGLVNNDTSAVVSGLQLGTAATALSGVGGYAITASGAAAANYSITFQPGTLTVGQRPITVTADALSRAYGDANPALTYTVGGRGLVNADTLSGALATTATAGSNVGLYAITQGTVLAGANYAVTFQGANLSVTPRPLTVTGARQADGTTLFATGTLSVSGGVAGETLSLTAGAGTAASAAVGAYPDSALAGLALAVAGGNGLASNYRLPTAGTLNITPAGLAPLTVTADSFTITYGQPLPTFTATTSVPNVALTGLTFAGSPALAAVNAGGYAINPSGATAQGYAITFVPGLLTINPLPVVVSGTRAYDGTTGFALGALSVSGGAPGETLALTAGSGAASSANVGTYAGAALSGLALSVAGGNALASNYALPATGTLAITRAPLTVTANDASRVYGDANPAFTTRFGGFVNSETAAVLGGTLGFATAATARSGVGPYAVTPSGLTSGNYQLTFVPGTLTVTPAPLLVRANDAQRLYGGANPALSATFSGLLNGDAPSVVQGLVLATPATAASGAGSYAITASGGTAANYALTFAPGTLTVTPAPLTVTANDASRLYGQANPSLSATFAGLVNGDTAASLGGQLLFGTAATAASGVGAYAITPYGVASPNYAITFRPGTLAVSPAPLTVAVNDASRLYGQANPLFGITLSGLVNNDTQAVLQGAVQFATAATSQSAVGPWLVTASGLNAANYILGYRPGTLAVLPATLTVRADDASRLAGQPNPAFSFTLSGLVNGDTAAVLQGIQLSTAAGTDSPPGLYPILAAGGAAPNYALIRVPGTLTVRAPDSPPIVITTTNQPLAGTPPGSSPATQLGFGPAPATNPGGSGNQTIVPQPAGFSPDQTATGGPIGNVLGYGSSFQPDPSAGNTQADAPPPGAN